MISCYIRLKVITQNTIIERPEKLSWISIFSTILFANSKIDVEAIQARVIGIVVNVLDNDP